MEAEHSGAWPLLAALEAIIAPALAARKPADDNLRVWVPGCSSGEIAYVVAGALYACVQQSDAPPSIRIFATDADANAIATAREGRYPDTLSSLIPSLWMRSFFLDRQHFQVAPAVRDMLTFAQHQLLHDPPFARLDLIVFGGAWDGFDRAAQDQILRIFHWSLRPQGYLLLDSVEDERLRDLFVSYGDMPGIHQRRAGPALTWNLSRRRAPAAPQPAASALAQRANALLQSMNRDLRRRVAQLAQANDDLSNLMSATDLATIFLDRALQIARFTPSAQKIFHMLPADRGRPLAHITHTLEYDQLIDDAANVFIDLQGSEREVRSADGRWYLARLRPYRTLDERIDGVVLILVDITARRKAEEEIRHTRDELDVRVRERTQELSAANAQLQAEIVARMRLERERTELLRVLVTTQEDERRRIARELHDQLGQSVSALGMGLGLLAGTASDPVQHQKIVARLQAITGQIDQDMRRLALELRPSLLDDLGLVEAVQHHVERWAEAAGIHAEFQAAGLPPGRLPHELESVVYRAVQEALTNVVKHAQARNVSVILERRRDQLRAIVEDDGRGFDLEALQQTPDAHQRLGLLGMRERAALAGGMVTIETAPGSGATLFIQLPLPPYTAEE